MQVLGVVLAAAFSVASAVPPAASAAAAAALTANARSLVRQVPSDSAPKGIEPHLLLDLVLDFRSVPTLIGEDMVRLNNGIWRDLEDPGFEFSLVDRLAGGDLDGDGAEDVVIILKQDMALDAEHYWLNAVVNRGGRAQPLAPPMTIGDGVTIDKLLVDRGIVRAEVGGDRGQDRAVRGTGALRVRVVDGRLHSGMIGPFLASMC